MEELTAKQQELGKAIEQQLTNFKKDPISRKNEDYFTKKLSQLNAHWTAFTAQHEKLLPFQLTNPSHLYFKNNYYDQISEVYHKYKDLLVAGQSGLHISTIKSGDSTTTSNPATTPTFITSQKTVPLSNVLQLLRKQKALMNTVVSFLNNIESNMDQEHPAQYYEYKIKTLIKYEEEMTNNNENIWASTIDTDLDDYDESQYHQLFHKLQDAIVLLQCRLSKLQKLPASQEAMTTTTNSQVKLPKITLPTFDGNYLKWVQFRDLYIQLIHHKDITAGEKMFYLISNLSGEALTLVKHLSVNNENYEDAWSILRHRYDNKRLLVAALLNKLLSQPTIHAESASNIKSLHDTTTECIFGLKNLGITVDSWDPILTHLLIKKLDKTTHTLYEQSLQAPRELISMKHLLDFLEQRFQALEAMNGRAYTTNLRPTTAQKSMSTFMTATTGSSCVLCNQNHALYACKEFLSKSPLNRVQIVKKHKLCNNCLKPGHLALACTLRSCPKCAKKHNSLLHQEDNRANQDKPPKKQETAPKNTTASLVAQYPKPQGTYILLSTVIVKATTKDGKTIECRAILDSGSQLNIVTKKLAEKLRLDTTSESLTIHGIGKSTHEAHQRVTVVIHSKINEYSTTMNAVVLPQITNYQPTTFLDTSSWTIPKNMNLADPKFHQPGPVDMLIGAEHYYEFLRVGQVKLGKELPSLQNTVFGWIVAGKIGPSSAITKGVCTICTQDDTKLEEQVERFWKLEEAEPRTPALTTAERKCEDMFNQTVTRNNEGRFVVRLPFGQQPNILGESRITAEKRLISLERKLKSNYELRKQYTEFMEEYIKLGHMEEIDFSKISKPYYFLPHHCIVKPDSTTTKLRVVFDASAKTSSKLSLNDVLYTGPKIQEELFSILIRFRFPRIVFTADIEKMYRQIIVDQEDRKFQLVLWRSDPQQPVKCYQLNTVTYGVTTAPYLAIKCIQRLSSLTKEQYPQGATALKQNMYVDDLMAGSNSLREALETQEQVNKILGSAGMKLRKWCANHPALLQHIPKEDRAQQLEFHEENELHIKTLGMVWMPKSDEFCITTRTIIDDKVTKRKVLSDIAHLFDPLGIMSPVVVTAKIMLQRLWNLKLDWDAAVPLEFHTSWNQFRQGLKELNNIRIPRHILSHKSSKNMQLHAFSDASEKAYGAAIYVRSVLTDGTISVRILCAKSRVAPAKTTTLPRLELCAAKLATQLLQRVKIDLNWQEQCYLWTDSEIVLAWINSTSSSFHTFVANRIATIQETSADQWRHVPSEQNPADLVSRGITPEKLQNCHLWFYGPIFLHAPESAWPPKAAKLETTLEKRQAKVVLSISQKPEYIINNIDHRNSFKHLQRTIAYILRFIKNTRQKKSRKPQTELTVEELENSLMLIVQQAQKQGFTDDLLQLQKTNHVDSRSSISSLSPFLDENGIIRVGGRLEAAEISFDAKHPILLPYPHFVTKLIMTNIHESHAHAGAQTLLSIARQKFWPIRGKTTARSIVQNCVRCTKTKPQFLHQLMGNLPPKRVQPARPFVNSGVDFCGPFRTHFKIRGKKPQKSYVAIFCCFATKAIHIEVVSDLTTEAFIGALKRFVSRRGNCRNIYCDNATNFVGAKNQLKELEASIHGKDAEQKIIKYCTTKGIEFHFIPPRAPHFGGLWEAAVKSAKHLFYKSIANASLTYEELETVMVEIEAILNSRPLTPMSNDPNDLAALTPGHFLIGEPLTSAVDSHAETNKSTLLQRWKVVSHLKAEFWQRWTKEYLCELQHRHKWKASCNNIQTGTMVIIKEDNVPVLSWPLGRIIQVIKGNDGLVRVADVKTASGVLRRPIHRLAPLPISNDDEEHENCTTEPSNTTKHDNTIYRHQFGDSSRAGKRNEFIKQNDEGSPTKKKRRCSNTALTTFLVTCLILPILGNTDINISPFSNQPGLYFENLGSVQLVPTEWKLVVYYDMKPYWREYNFIRQGIDKLSLMCGSLKDEKICNETIFQFNTILMDITSNNKLLVPHSHHRSRRAPLDIIGNIASSLFGVLDSKYAEKMSHIIENLGANDQHLLDLIKNQTTVVDSTINLIQKTQQTNEKQLQEFNEYLNKTLATVAVMSQQLNDQRTMEFINALFIRLSLAITNYQRMQGILLDVLVDTHQGKVNPQLITPSQLQTQLNIIKDNLPTTLRLPMEGSSLLGLYSIMTIEGRVMSQHIIFRIKLPLCTLDHFEILKVVSVPILLNNTFLIITSTSPFLIVNLHRDLYYPLTEQEMSTCSTLGNSVHLCKQHHPLYHKGSQPSICEMDILTQTATTSSCELSKSEETPRWIQLLKPNHWIYVMKKETPINVKCERTVIQRNLVGSGILNITNGCSLRDDKTTITAHNLYTSSIRTSFWPSGNFTDSIHPSKLFRLLYHPTTPQNLTQDIEQMKKKLERLHQLEDATKTTLSHHDVHQYSIAYGSLFIITGLLLTIFIRYIIKRYQHASKPPTPPPRTTSPEFRVETSVQRGQNVSTCDKKV